MDNSNNQQTTSNINVFDNRFLSSKNLYMHYFGTLPNVNYIGSIDGEKAFRAFKEKHNSSIKKVHQYNWYKHENKKYQFDKTMLVLEKNFLIEFVDNCCYILHDGEQNELLEEVTVMAKQFKERQRKMPLEINLIVRNGNGMELKEMEIKRTKLDLNLFYEDEFKAVDETIRARLNKKKDKGIVLLHGLPGCRALGQAAAPNRQWLV